MEQSSPESSWFYEEQRFRKPILLVLIFFLVAMSWYAFFQQIISKKPFGDNPAPDAVVWGLWIVFGIVFPVFFLAMKLTTEVRQDAVHIRFVPGHRRVIRMEEIKSVEVREYRPVRDYGGWGIRYSAKQGLAYNVSGNKGVQLELTSGKRVLIGSQQSDRLADTLREALRSRR
jgi:di/tricarboxylate transporter